MNTPEIPKEMAAAMLLMVIYFVNIYVPKDQVGRFALNIVRILSGVSMYGFYFVNICLRNRSGGHFALDVVRRVHRHGFEFKFVFIVMPNIWS